MKATRALTMFVALAFLGLVLLILSTRTARAADPVVIRVKVDGATSGSCGDTWANACGLQYALTSTAALPGTELWVAAGTYTPTAGADRTATFQLRDNIALYGGFAGGETLRSLRNITSNVTILSGDLNGNDNNNVQYDEPTRAENAYHVVTGSGVTNTAVLDGFAVMGGNANGLGYSRYYGGGIFNSLGSPTLRNVSFISNTASNDGGGMFNHESKSTLTNVSFSSNSSSNSAGRGGGVFNEYFSSPMLTSVIFVSNTAGAGGGMFNDNSSPTLANTTFSGNSADSDGGGMYNYGRNAGPTLTNVTFISNTATFRGGGMYSEYGSMPTLTNVSFRSNLAGMGGGMYNYYSSPMLIDTTLVSNTATGGGMYNSYSSPTLANVTFSGNSAPYGRGGGMYNEYGSNAILTNVSFNGNWAPFSGGMYNDSSSPALTNTTFVSNTATGYHGGGMFNDNSSPTLTNTTFSGNSAPYGRGGGMYNYGSRPTVTNATFSGNSALNGGGMLDLGEQSSPMIRNAILWGNTAANGSQIYDLSSTSSLSDSAVEGGCPSGVTCTHVLTANPRLGSLANYGGGTQTIPLLPGSSAINTGNNATCAPTDQRGKPRVGTCDIGAFESQGFALTKTSGDNQSTRPSMAFANPLRVAASSAYGEPVNGGVVTFMAPSSGASAVPVTSSVSIASGAAVQTVTANGTAGSYAVTVNASGAIAPASFTLTNALYDYLPLIRK